MLVIYEILFLFMGISLVLTLFLLLLFFLYRKKLQKKDDEIKQLTHDLEDLQQKINQQQKRKTFRLDILDADCEFTLLKMENEDLEDIKDKLFTGKVKDISITGLKLASVNDFPVRKHITVQLDFTIREETFSLKGKLVRKEEQQDNRYVCYGVKFVEMRIKDEEKLFTIQRHIEIERHKKSVD